MKKILLCALLLSLSACTTFTKKQCEEMNWEAKGYSSAFDGDTPGEGVKYYDRNCRAEHGVPVNAELFAKGYGKGLEAFCSADHIRIFAEKGGVYKGTCPEKVMTVGFVTQYQNGREQYLLKRISTLESRISDLESTIHSQDSEISSLKSNSCQP
jgi:hypothetical protein